MPGCPFIALGLVVYRRAWRRSSYALDAIVTPGLGLVALAGADHLAVRGLQVESKLTATRSGFVEALIIRAILLDGCNTIFARAFRLVAFTRKNGLTIACFQSKSKLTRFIFVTFEFSSHYFSLLSFLTIRPAN